MKTRLLNFVALIVGLSAGVGGALLLSSHSTSSADACRLSTSGAKHYAITISGSKAAPELVHGKLCDTLTITNQDDIAREIAFGPHDHHVAYDGVAEQVLRQGQSLKVTLNQTGTFHWHDHLHDSVQGNFTASP
jgi:hypothetical protein